MQEIQVNNVTTTPDGDGKITFTVTYEDGTHLNGSIISKPDEFKTMAFNDFSKLIVDRINKNINE